MHDSPNAYQQAALQSQTLTEARTNVCKRKRRSYSDSARQWEMSIEFEYVSKATHVSALKTVRGKWVIDVIL